VAEEPGSPTAVDEFRQTHLYLSDPFHSRGRALAVTLAVAFMTVFEGLDKIDARVPLVSLTLLGVLSAWARWRGRKLDAAAFRRSLSNGEVLLRWVLPVFWLILAGLILGYAYLLRVRWEMWQAAPREMPADIEAFRGRLVFPGDWRIFALAAIYGFLFGWIYLVFRPRLRAALARA